MLLHVRHKVGKGFPEQERCFAGSKGTWKPAGYFLDKPHISMVPRGLIPELTCNSQCRPGHSSTSRQALPAQPAKQHNRAWQQQHCSLRGQWQYLRPHLCILPMGSLPPMAVTAMAGRPLPAELVRGGFLPCKSQLPGPWSTYKAATNTA